MVSEENKDICSKEEQKDRSTDRSKWRLFPKEDQLAYWIYRRMKRPEQKIFRRLIAIKDQTPEENAKDLRLYLQFPKKSKELVDKAVLDDTYVDLEYRLDVSKGKTERWKFPPLPRVIREELKRKKWDRAKWISSLLNAWVAGKFDFSTEDYIKGQEGYFRVLAEEWGVPIETVKKMLKE